MVTIRDKKRFVAIPINKLRGKPNFEPLKYFGRYWITDGTNVFGHMSDYGNKQVITPVCSTNKLHLVEYMKQFDDTDLKIEKLSVVNWPLTVNDVRKAVSDE